MKDNPSLKDVILEMTPFSQELIDWCKSHPEFLNALKNVYPEKFISAGIVVEHPPISTGKHHGEIVTGVYTYHHGINKSIFKQDFIVYNGHAYTLYSRNPEGSKKYVRDINEFYKNYSQYGHTRSKHHLNLEDLPAELQERGRRVISLAKKLNPDDLINIPQEHINEIYRKLMSIPREERFIKLA